jgi:hypothetical protein
MQNRLNLDQLMRLNDDQKSNMIYSRLNDLRVKMPKTIYSNSDKLIRLLELTQSIKSILDSYTIKTITKLSASDKQKLMILQKQIIMINNKIQKNNYEQFKVIETYMNEFLDLIRFINKTYDAFDKMDTTKSKETKQNKLQTLQDKKEEIEKKIIDLSQKIISKENEIKQLDGKLFTLEKTIETLSKESDTFKKTNDEIKKLKEKRSTLYQDIEQIDIEKNKLTSQLISVTSELNKLKKKQESNNELTGKS